MKRDTITWKETAAVHLRAWKEIRKYCPGVFPAIFLYGLLSALSPYVSFFLSAQLLNELSGLHRPEILGKWAILIIALTALLSLITGAANRWQEAACAQFYRHKDKRYSDKLRSMDFADMDKTQTHDLLSQIRQNENWSGWGFNQFVWQMAYLTKGFFGILGASVLSVSLFTTSVPESAGRFTVLNHPAFLVVSLLLLTGVTVLGPFCKNKATGYWARFSQEATLGNRLFGAFGFTASEQSRAADFRMYNQQTICRFYMETNRTFCHGGVMHQCAKGPMGAWAAASGAVGAVLTGLVYVFVCLKAWAGAFGVGSITQYVGAITALSGNMSLLLQAAGTLKNNVPYMRTIYQFLDIPNTMYQGSLTTEKRSDRNYTVEFRDVSFRYPGSELYALRHVNLRFKVGSRMAVVGENGSGKTTFIKLLCRLYDPTEGEILLNGIDIRKYRYDEHMQLFSVVFQDFQLLTQPLGNNVSGNLNYDRQRAKKALEDAGFGERLATLSQGLDTMLYKEFGENGVEVSGGEAQKIAIARALYKDAPFIILDEPTAALDPIAEAEIYSKFNDIVTDKTAIYISHRLSSCKFCDEILVFHQGAVIQQGTHDDLLAQETGKYHQLWHAQAQYYTT